MNRRDFLKTATACATLLTPMGALAQTPAPIIERVSQKIADAIERAFELDMLPEDQIEWIEGISNGQTCTFTASEPESFWN